MSKGGKADQKVLSPDGRLAALAEGNTVYVVETSTGRERFQIDSAKPVYRRLIFTRDSGRLVIVDDKIRWCDAASGQVIASFHQEFDGWIGLALSADGLTLAVAGYGPKRSQFSIFRLDAATQKVTSQAQDTGHTISAAALSPDGRLLATNFPSAGWVHVIDTQTGRPIAKHGSAHAAPVSALTFSGDGYKLVTADVEGTIKIWEDARKLTSKSAAARTLKGHEAAITQVGFSSDGRQLVSTSADQTARIWDLERAGAAIRVLERAGAECHAARFSPDGQWIAAADGTSVRLWDAATGRLVRELSAGDKSLVSSVAFSPTNNRLLAVGYHRQADVSLVVLWDVDGGRELARLSEPPDLPDHLVGGRTGAVSALAFSPDGKYLVAGFGTPNLYTTESSPNPLKVWEVATRRLVRRLSGHTGFCFSLAFSRDGRLLASGSHDGTAILWSTAPWKAIRTLRNPDPGWMYSQAGAEIQDVALSPDGKTLALASRAATVQFWDVATGELRATLKGHSSGVNAVAFSPDGRTLASGGTDHTVRLWNVETRRELMQLDSGGVELEWVHTVTFAPDGQRLLAGGHGTAFWSTAPVVWNEPARAAEELRRILQSNADFQSRIRMLSENLRLYAALEQLDSNDVRVSAALAAAQANWHASRRAWPEAAQAFDRLVAADPADPAAWLRTPGLLRLATALLHQNRPRDAAALLTGGARRRTADGLPAAVYRERLVDDAATGELLHPLLDSINERLAQTPRHPGLLELRAELAGQWSGAVDQVADYTAAIEALSEQDPAPVADLERLYGRRGIAYVQFEAWPEAVADFAHAVGEETTDEALLTNQARALTGVLLQSQNPAAAMKLTDPWARLAAAYRLNGNPQAVDQLVERHPKRAGQIGDGFLQDQDKDWSRVVEIYSRGITAETTDVDLLAKRAHGHEALQNWEAAAADWSRAATGNPEGATLLGEFARRAAASGQLPLANGQFEKAQALYERSLDADPENDLVAMELAHLLWNKHESASAARETVRQPTKLRFTPKKRADPWLELALAYAGNGRHDEALKYLGRALQQAHGSEARKPILERAARFDDLLVALVQQQPDDAQFQLALARKLAERGKQRLREKQLADALADLERSRAIFQRLRAGPEWTVLTRASTVADLYVALATAQAQQGHVNESVALFTEALNLAADRIDKGRIIAAAAALATAGQSQDGSAVPLDDAARARLRRQALDWMKAELTAWTRLVESAPPQDRWSRDRLTIALALRRLQRDSNLAGVRDEAALAQLPPEEQKAFSRFWADAAELSTAADGGFRALPAAQQVEEIRKELKKRNPGFDGSMTHTIEGGVVTQLQITGKDVKDLSPVGSLVELKRFECSRGPLSDLSPLKGLLLTDLNLRDTQVQDLSPLKGMPVARLALVAAQVSDLEPLKGMPLSDLYLWGCLQVRNLEPLKGMPLTRLNLYACQVQDLEPLEGMRLTSLYLAGCTRVDDVTPLRGMPLTELNLDGTQVPDLEPLTGMPLTKLSLWLCFRVKDLEPLKGIPLKNLSIEESGVSDLKPLQGMPLEEIRLTPKNFTQGLDLLRDVKSLETIGIAGAPAEVWPAAEFWQRYDKGEFK
jgi:WD40 repeat protein/tetratricopeptide (TPR) repeat protein